MLIIILEAIIVFGKACLVMCLLCLAYIGVDLAIFEVKDHKARRRQHARQHAKDLFEELRENAKQKLREKKEADAQETAHFLPADFVSNFDHDGKLIYRDVTVPSEPNWEFYKKVDGVADAEIFEKTEEL